MTKKTETFLLFMLFLVVLGGISYEFFYLQKQGMLKEGVTKAKDAVENQRAKIQSE
ncbi:hypothetical protein KKC88_05605 [Patescibacteria group bacterium]|nr:hypothetical protein [Patescibacteria group bacterium]MBU1673277.1 hypothetical protein [Patescibacteria group bacterium]MBU1964085.1 hypothetical protein [Patescibacteria group bacterium]